MFSDQNAFDILPSMSSDATQKCTQNHPLLFAHPDGRQVFFGHAHTRTYNNFRLLFWGFVGRTHLIDAKKKYQYYSVSMRSSSFSSNDSDREFRFRNSGQWQTCDEPLIRPTEASLKARARWLRAGRKACLAKRVLYALKPEESRYARKNPLDER